MAIKKIYSKMPRGLRFDLTHPDTGELVISITINGYHTPGCLLPGHGVTEMDEEVWEEILRRYGSMSAFRNEHIFCANNTRDAIAYADERVNEKTKMDQLDPREIRGTVPSDDKKVNTGLRK